MKKMKRKKSKKKKLSLILGIIILLTIVITLIILNIISKKEPKIIKNDVVVTLVSDLEVEINSEVHLLSFIKEVENGRIVTEDSVIDTSILGEKELTIKIESDDD